MQHKPSSTHTKPNKNTAKNKDATNARLLHDWPALIQQWEKSGLPQKEFCHAHALSYANFVYHRVQLKKARKLAMPPLLPVKKISSPLDFQSAPMGFTIKWPSGICLCVPMAADAATLNTLLTHLGG